MTFFKPHLDSRNGLESVQRILLENYKAGFVSLRQRSDVSPREDGARRGFAPHLQEREVVEHIQRVKIQGLRQRGVGVVASDGDRDVMSMEQT